MPFSILFLVPEKSYVWHKKIAIYHIQRIAVVNAFVLGKQYFPDFMKNKTFANFSLSVVERLIHAYDIPNPRTQITHNSNAHFPVKLLSTGLNPRPSKCCQQCWRVAPAGTRRVRESTYYCSGCPQSPVLHIDCFPAWHS